MLSNEEMDDIITNLILNGGLEVSGIDSETGDLTYSYTERLKTVNPELQSAIMELFHTHVMALWELGFINMNPLEENPVVTLTSFATDPVAIDSLHSDLKRTLKLIVMKFEEQ